MKISGEDLGSGGRYDRQKLIAWWDQERVAAARVLLVGAGALGNEVLKNLALTGVGQTLVFDPDVIERSNLSRTVLFREEDEGRNKAVVAAERTVAINGEVVVHGRGENVITHAGLGVFHWADVVIGAVDNREARVWISAASGKTGKKWVDGAIEGLAGVVRGFDPSADGASCYECTMNATDRKLLAERRSCAMLARDIVARGHVPTTAVAASVIGAMQVSEAVKVLHGQPALLGEGLHVDALWGEASRVRYPRKEGCPGHERLGEIADLGLRVADVTVGELIARAEAELGEGASIDLSRDVVAKLRCPSCGDERPGRAALGALRERDAACPKCGTHRVVDVAAALIKDDPTIDPAMTLAELGVPPYDIVVARNGFESARAWLFGGDAAEVLGPLAGADQKERRVANRRAEPAIEATPERGAAERPGARRWSAPEGQQ